MAWLIYFCFGLISFSLAPLVTLIMKDLNLTYTEVGFIAGAWPLMFIIFSYPEGYIIDRLGVKKSLALGIFLISVSSIFRGLASDFFSLFTPTAFFGIGAPMISIGLPKLVSTWFSGKERGIASGIYYTGVSSGTAFSLGATNSIILPFMGTWKNCFFLYGFVGLVITIIWIRFARSRPEYSSAERTGGNRKTWKTMVELLRHRNILLTVIVGSTTFITVHSLNNWLPKILESQMFTAVMAGYIAAIFSLFRILGSLIIPRLSYSIGSRKISVSVILIMTASSVFFIASAFETLLWLGIITIGFCMGALTPILLTILMDMPEVGSKYMGSAGGLFFSIGEVGGIIGPVLIGFLKDLTGSFFPGLFMLAFIAIIMLALNALVK